MIFFPFYFFWQSEIIQRPKSVAGRQQQQQQQFPINKRNHDIRRSFRPKQCSLLHVLSRVWLTSRCRSHRHRGSNVAPLSALFLNHHHTTTTTISLIYNTSLIVLVLSLLTHDDLLGGGPANFVGSLFVGSRVDQPNFSGGFFTVGLSSPFWPA